MLCLDRWTFPLSNCWDVSTFQRLQPSRSLDLLKKIRCEKKAGFWGDPNFWGCYRCIDIYHMYIYIHNYIYTCTCIHTCNHERMYIYISIYTYIFICIKQIDNIYNIIHVYIYIYVNICINIFDRYILQSFGGYTTLPGKKHLSACLECKSRENHRVEWENSSRHRPKSCVLFQRFFVIELVRSAMSAQMIFSFICNIMCVDNYLYSWLIL